MNTSGSQIVECGNDRQDAARRPLRTGKATAQLVLRASARHVRVTIIVGTAIILAAIGGGSELLLQRAKQAAVAAAETRLKNLASVVENTINRQLLQVDSTLVSLAPLFNTVSANKGEADSQAAQRLLKALDFQSFAFRDLLLLHPDGSVWASARPRPGGAPLGAFPPYAGSTSAQGAASIKGPVRNSWTGTWSWFLVRTITIAGMGESLAAAEVPVPLVLSLLSPVGEIPGLRIRLERPDGTLLASLPHDELRIGRKSTVVIENLGADGIPFEFPSAVAPTPALGIWEHTLYPDVRLVLSVDLASAIMDWTRDKDRLIAAAGVTAILILAFAGALYAAQMQRERVEAEQAQLDHMSLFDALTDLPNRAFFQGRLNQEARRGERLAILCVDLDDFKTVNDTLGHPAGDSLLKMVADRLRKCVRDSDFIARLGGDEFAVIQFHADQPAQAEALARRLIEEMGTPCDVAGSRIEVGLSIGIALVPADGTTSETLLKKADLALYRAKAEGRGIHRFFEPAMHQQMQARRQLELDAREALANHDFRLNFQPIVDITNGCVVCFEALLRWQHRERGLVSPSEFVPLAEELGLIIPIGDWALRAACHEAVNWPDNIRVAVNLSAVQLKNPSLVDAVQSALDSSGLRPDRLELEITESILLRDSARTLATLARLHDLGISIAMDDFGTGYSSLSYLSRFPFDKIKIDQCFVREINTKAEALAVIRAVVHLGRALEITVVAEGVETAEQLERVRVEGCGLCQGFLFSRPCAPGDVMSVIEHVSSRTHASSAY